MSRLLPPFVIRGFRRFGTWIPVLLLAACARKPEPMTIMDESWNALCRSPLDSLVLVGAPVESPAGFWPQSVTTTRKKPACSVTTNWPEMVPTAPGHEVFNEAVKALVRKAEADFLAGVEPAEDSSLPTSTFTLDYSVAWADSAVVSVRLPVELYYTGAAHPFHYEMTLVVDRQAGRVLKLEDLFMPDSPWLETLSGRCSADLSARLEDSFFPEGTEARPENFDRWLLAEHTLTLLFDPYQVAPWVAGPQEVEISLTDLQSLLAPGIAKP